jgi:hypothetical protein
MVDLDVLEAMGSTQERLRQIFTAQPPPTDAEKALLPEEACDRLEKDIKLRDRFESDINRRFSEQINYALQNYQMYSAVDVAWDAAPINKETYPLLLYAQGRLDLGKCGKQLKDLPCVDKYTTKDAQGNIVGVNLPKFFEVNFNLVRSVITRRLAAQANKYMALYPYYKYEPRSTSQVGKLRADVLSQVMDIQTDQFDHRHHEVQVMRDAMLYGHCVDFVRARWEREEQTIFDPDINPELRDPKDPKYKTVITKEGVGWVNPHPSRIFWDNAYPMSSINCDVGSEFIGFWDVIRYGDIAANPKYWNRSTISYSATIVQLFSTYAQYFSQYYCTIIPPCDINTLDLSARNDRLNNLGLYAQDMRDSSMIIAEYFKKIVPKDWGIGDYPFPVWLRMKVAGDKTVVYAEFLPSSPACYCGINENDSRQLNISIGMELLPYQDQMTQLLSFLLMVLQGDFQRILCVDIDTATPEMIKQFRIDVQGKERYVATKVFEYSGAKLKDLGINPKDIITLVQTAPSQAITMIFQAMAQLISLSERLLALSPHELGQPAPREISATEVNMMAGTTETIYGFISDAIDEYRSAKKRVLYESYMICGSQTIRVPIASRYTKAIIQKAGFEVFDEDEESIIWVDREEPAYHTITGTKSKLLYEYIYTSRDGGLRAVNTQSANVLTQLLGTLQNPILLQSIKKEKLFEIYNEIFRLSGAAVDLNLEVEAGESNQMGPNKQQQMEQVLQSLTQHAEQDAQGLQQAMAQIQDLGKKFEEMINVVKELTSKVDEIDKKPNVVQVDPMKFIMGRQKMNMDRAQGAQKMRHAEETHAVDTAIKGMKAMAEVSDRESAYAK